MAVRRTTALLLVLGWATFLAGLGRPAIGDSDEAFYAEAGREMLATGDWLTPHYSGQPRFQKPILTYWLVAGAFKVAGVHEGAARMFPAMAGVALALLTAAIGRRWYDEETGRIGGAIVASAFGYFSIGRLVLPDLLLAALVTLAIWALLRGAFDAPSRGRTPWATAGVALGLAILTKGPVALALAVLIVAPIYAIERRRLQRPWPGIALALGLALLIAAPWYVAMTTVHGTGYLRTFLLGDNLERFTTARFNDPRPWWFYVPIIAGGLLPWTPVALCAWTPLAQWSRGRMRAGAETWRLAWWAIAPLLFFSISIGKQPRYILPLLPPLALLMARAIAVYLAERGAGSRALTLRAAGVLVGGVVVALAALLHRAMSVVVNVPSVLVSAAGVAIAAAGLGLLVLSAVGRARLIPLGVGFAAALSLAGLHFALSPAGRDPVQEMASLVAAHRTTGQRLGTYRVFVRNLVFYTHVPSDDLTGPEEARRFLAGREPVLCVMRRPDLERVAAGLPVRVLGEVLYLNASAVRLRTLFSPNPALDLEHVVLVSNR